MPSFGGSLRGLFGISSDLRHALHTVADNFQFAREFAHPVGPVLGKQLVTFIRGLVVQLARRSDAFLWSSLRACQGAPKTLVERQTHQFGRVGVPDMAAITGQVTFDHMTPPQSGQARTKRRPRM